MSRMPGSVSNDRLAGPVRSRISGNRVVEIVREMPDLASLEILRRVKESGYPGGKTALYALVA
jgi:hypothetical protein